VNIGWDHSTDGNIVFRHISRTWDTGCILPSGSLCFLYSDDHIVLRNSHKTHHLNSSTSTLSMLETKMSRPLRAPFWGLHPLPTMIERNLGRGKGERDSSRYASLLRDFSTKIMNTLNMKFFSSLFVSKGDLFRCATSSKEICCLKAYHAFAV
jgi:hypothetical protein